MKTLNDSSIFLSNPDIKEITKKMQSISMYTDIIPVDTFDSEMSTINRRFNFGTENEVINEFKNGTIQFIDNPTLVLPKYVMTVGKVIDRKIIMVINLSGYLNSKKEIYPKKLFGLMQVALINNACYKNWNKFINNMNFLKSNSLIYSRLVTRIFDKLFSIDLNKQSTDLVSFLFSKFFLITMCDKTDNELVNNIAYNSCFNKTSLSMIKSQEDELQEEFLKNGNSLYDTIFTLFESLKNIPQIKDTNIRLFIENYVRMYGESTLLSLDYLPSFLDMIYSQVVGADLNKEFMLEKNAGREINKSYVTFLNLI